MELISIIMPIYNNPKTLARAIDSCLQQKYPDTEIILVNDGSDEDTYDIINDYWERYPNIKIVNQRHQEILMARLNGLKNASGDFVTFVDSDDYINNTYLYELMYTRKYSAMNVVLSRMHYVGKGLFNSTSQIYPNEFLISEHKEALLTIDSSLNGKLFRRKDLTLPNYKLSSNEAMSYLYYYLCKEDKIGFSNFAKYYVTPSKMNFSRIYADENLRRAENIIKSLDIMFELYRSSKMLNKYYNEIEAIFIKNVFLEMDRLKRRCNDKNVVKKTICFLIKYLNYHFPNWRDNKYLKRCFIDFNNELFVKLNLVGLRASHCKTSACTCEAETLRNLKRVLK